MLLIALMLTSSALFCASGSASSSLVKKSSLSITLGYHSSHNASDSFAAFHSWKENTHPHLPCAGSIATIVERARMRPSDLSKSTKPIAQMLITYFPACLVEINKDISESQKPQQELLVAALQKAVFRINKAMLNHPLSTRIFRYLIAAQYGEAMVFFDTQCTSSSIFLPPLATEDAKPCKPGRYFYNPGHDAEIESGPYIHILQKIPNLVNE